jgi:uncharacterized membrane protein
MNESRTPAVIAYILHLFGAALALPSIVGLIINYIKRGDSGALLASHHSWMIRTFWWTLLWSVIVVLSYFFLIGFAIGGIAFFVLWIWYLYRHVRGLIALANVEPPMPP